jgi:hypothetical protein
LLCFASLPLVLAPVMLTPGCGGGETPPIAPPAPGPAPARHRALAPCTGAPVEDRCHEPASDDGELLDPPIAPPPPEPGVAASTAPSLTAVPAAALPGAGPASASPRCASLCRGDSPCLARCRKERIEECNALIDEANASQDAFVDLGKAMLDKKVLAERVKTIRGANAKVKAVALDDLPLQRMQTKWVEGLEAMAAGLEETSKLDQANDAEKITNAAGRFIQDAAEMSKLVDEINRYCQQP